MAGRRGAGEGSIRRRKDGLWEARLTVGYEGGRQQRRSVYGKTRAETARKLAEALRAHDSGQPFADARTTLADYLDRWLEDFGQSSLRPRTYEGYSIVVRRHLVPGLGHIPLSKLSPDAIREFMKRKLASGLSGRSVQYQHAVLRRALGHAEAHGLVQRNVAKLVTPPRPTRREVHPLSAREARQFLESVRGNRLEALYTLALVTGLRQGELLGLSWSDVDLDAGVLAVRHALQRHGGAYHLVEPKTRASRRTLALPAGAVQLLRQHKVRQLEERLHAGVAWKGNDWDLVFTTVAGSPLNTSVVTHTFRRPSSGLGFRANDSTTCATRQRRSCLLRVFRSRWRRQSLVTPRSALRRMCTATLPPSCTGRPQSALVRYSGPRAEVVGVKIGV